MEVLHILRGLAPALDVQSVDKCLPALAPLLASISGQGNRTAICQSLEEFARVDSSLSTVVCNFIHSFFAGDSSPTFCSGFFHNSKLFLKFFSLLVIIMCGNICFACAVVQRVHCNVFNVLVQHTWMILHLLCF